jgi:hypothetical protein
MTGKLTHEQNQRIINREENTRGADVPTPGETIEEARRRHATTPPALYDIETGDRSVKRGAHDPTEHDKSHR